ncbi:hypothetical protein D9619_012570 [Psilocybe cf. subviscida]|uniref:Uncharacterized protein n=1 Tax=Psilocybe cf. subviscida TaxID=2480587 RepID=A0A8H5B6I4_9AGAR|nr:hypothetical protein D9619_012570 [Psilocybe cf. subviscida]
MGSDSARADAPAQPQRPISSYTAAALERVYKRWMVVEKAWKVTTENAIGVKQLELDPGCLAKASILSPAGRWLIVFTNLIGAVYFDLDSNSQHPTAIIPAQIQSGPGRDNRIHVEVSAPEVVSTAGKLSFAPF